MLRQRVLTRSFPLARVAADGLVLIFALVLVWGGAMLVLLAFKASPDTINGLSGYRTAYDYLAGLEAQDVTASTRLIADVNPRVIQRMADIAVLDHPAVIAARARYATDDLTLDVSAGRADELAATLYDLHQRACDSLARHELPPLPVNITLVRLEQETRRELQ